MEPDPTPPLRRPRLGPWLAPIGAGLLVAPAAFGAAAWLGRGRFVPSFLALAAGSASAPLLGAGLACLVLGLLRRRLGKGRVLLGLAAACLTLGPPLAGIGLSVVPGRALLARDVDRAKLYCRGLVPRLEAARRAAGGYPESLSEIGERPEERPRLLRDNPYEFYASDGETFTFDFVDPSGMLEGLRWDSRVGDWERWD